MTEPERTPYAILDVPENIGYPPLRQVYRQKIHDHLSNKISAINFRRICRAYETLSDFDKRKLYDSKKEWISDLPLHKYTPQQLAAEPDLIRDLKQRLQAVNLTQINAQDSITGHTALYTAARAGNVEAVKYLTEQGADPDLAQRIKSTALHVASFYGHPNVVRYLLESGADYRIRNQCNGTAEDEALNNEVKKVFTELKAHDYVRAAVNELDWFRSNKLTQHQDKDYFSQRQTLLHCASKKGHVDLVHWLVEQCMANIDLNDSNGNTALHLAAYGGHESIVSYLLNRGCDSTIRNRWGTTAEDEGSKHGSRITNLFKEMRERDMFEMARIGVDWWFYYHFQSDTKDLDDSNGVSLLYYACRFGHYNVAKWLLEHGANVNMQMKTTPKSTPLHVAKYRGHSSLVVLLLEYGADVNIKNDFGVNVFNEDFSVEVDKSSEEKIREILLQYQRNLKSDKSIDIHIYHDLNGNEPVAKIKLSSNSKYKELLDELSKVCTEKYESFSIARRMLVFKDENTTVISAVARARYVSSIFLEFPIRLIGHTMSLSVNKNIRYHSEKETLSQREFGKKFDSLCQNGSFTINGPLETKQEVKINNLLFMFSEGSLTEALEWQVQYLMKPDPNVFNIPGCICLFKVIPHGIYTKSTPSASVSLINEPDARLYTLAQSSFHWFSAEARRVCVNTMDTFYAFIQHVKIIIHHLVLPVDVFVAAVLDQPLEKRTKPVNCTCLVLRNHDPTVFPHIAYHGTAIEAVRSIIYDGLVLPGTLISTGKRVSPPKGHIARDVSAFGFANFADAVFFSPSMHYSSDPVYARPFTHGDQQLIPVLQCSLKGNCYSKNHCTVAAYKQHLDDNMDEIEWRVKDPGDVEINSILFITQIESIEASKSARVIFSS